MTKFPNSPNCQMGAGDKKFRHPERSETNDFFPRGGLIRAQSKDPAALPFDYRIGMNVLHAVLASRPGVKMPFPVGTPTGWTTRSFDSGSAKPFAKTPTPLAFAQDDGVFKTNFSFRAPRGLNLKPNGYPLKWSETELD
jgi:hypothetical protein